MRAYYLKVAEELDNHYEPCIPEKESMLTKLLGTDLVEYYNTDINPFMAASYIAKKLGCKLISESCN